ncbi:hypothetical protein, partial [uncultured Dialister sp.]|uniref:hypothetical protein n=1 Tax=uncultured Dialister sp. TaxID=278064 RepID=UPI0027DC6A44
PKGELPEREKALMSHLFRYHSADLAACGGHPLSGCAGLSPLESVSRDFQVAIAPLQITFACHPIQGTE